MTGAERERIAALEIKVEYLTKMLEKLSDQLGDTNKALNSLMTDKRIVVAVWLVICSVGAAVGFGISKILPWFSSLPK